jgi:hypothetical protein
MPASKKTSTSPAKAKPAAEPAAAKSDAKSVTAEAAKPAEEKTAAAPKAPVKGKPQIPGKPEPSWAKFNQGGHAQKMSKGRPFRHQGR